MDSLFQNFVFKKDYGHNICRQLIYSYIPIQILELYLINAIDHDDIMFVEHIIQYFENTNFQNICDIDSMVQMIFNYNRLHIATLLHRTYNIAISNHNVVRILYTANICSIKWLYSTFGNDILLNYNILVSDYIKPEQFDVLRVLHGYDVDINITNDSIVDSLTSMNNKKLKFYISLGMQISVDHISLMLDDDIIKNDSLFENIIDNINYLFIVNSISLVPSDWISHIIKCCFEFKNSDDEVKENFINMLHSNNALVPNILHKLIHKYDVSNNIYSDSFESFMMHIVSKGYNISPKYLYRWVTSDNMVLDIFESLLLKFNYIQIDNDDHIHEELELFYQGRDDNEIDLDDDNMNNEINDLYHQGFRLAIQTLLYAIQNIHTFTCEKFCQYLLLCKS
jgi:hypothetical protein